MNTKSNSPIFISGLYRSGTTYLANLIDEYTDYIITYGTIHFMRCSYNQYLPLTSNIEKLFADNKKRISEKWDLNLDSDAVLSSLNINKDINQAEVYDVMMRTFLNIPNIYNWGEKTNNQWESLIPFLELFPNGKAIHIIRDPRAVLASFKNFTFHPEPMYLDSIFAASAMFNHIENIKHKNLLIIKYEDLVKNFDQEMNELMTFLKQEKKSTLDKSFVTNNKPYQANSSFGKAGKSNSLNTWNEKLTNLEIYFCQFFLHDEILRNGYELIDIKLSDQEKSDFDNLTQHKYLKPRIAYWKKNGYGIQSFPETGDAYYNAQN